MPYHHLAIAARDMVAVDAFYTRAMGFELVKVEVGKTPKGGWAKHFFYDTGDGELLAFWEIHDDGEVPADYGTGLSRAAGLPDWVNHVAFRADDLDDIAARRQRLTENGHDVVEIDHRWCTSIYTVDPTGTLVEFCTTTKAFDQADRDRAREALTSDNLELVDPKSIQVHRANAG